MEALNNIEGSCDKTSASSHSPKSKCNKHLEKLKSLKNRRFESKRLNRAEVVEEDRKNKLPSNWESRQQRVEWKLDDIKKRKKCEEIGVDYERRKVMDVSAADADRWDSNKKRKKDPDQGFSTFQEAGARHYRKLVRQIKPNMEEYNQQKEEMGEETFYAGINTLLPGQVKDTKEGIDRMVQDLEAQMEKKKNFRRRRAHDESKDIDYINESNARHNERLEKFYGKYTAEIKQNLERGTAV
uniref:Pre-mRNA-splicing factor SYF2 n=1 Tax=Phallusia mammillata TaxID=59560 RepID=A0A6F9DTJ6_9ASCI|nr:pre-mRNA-splicing factor syf2 [Phallusia mammillata]